MHEENELMKKERDSLLSEADRRIDELTTLRDVQLSEKKEAEQLNSGMDFLKHELASQKVDERTYSDIFDDLIRMRSLNSRSEYLFWRIP